MKNLEVIDEVHTDNMLYKVKSSLEEKGFSVIIARDRGDLRKFITKNIPDDVTVGLDGSDIYAKYNIDEYLSENWNVVVKPGNNDLAPEIRKYLEEKLYSADYYITRPDAITLDGRVVFRKKNKFLIDKNSNKPSNIYAISDINVLVKNLAQAQEKLSSKDLTVLEVSPFGFKKRFIDNSGQIEDYDELIEDNSKQNEFVIVLVNEGYAY